MILEDRLEELFVIVAAKDDKEGIMGFDMGTGMTPMLTSRDTLLPRLIQIAKEIQSQTNVGFKILRFSNREELTPESFHD